MSSHVLSVQLNRRECSPTESSEALEAYGRLIQEWTRKGWLDLVRGRDSKTSQHGKNSDATKGKVSPQVIGEWTRGEHDQRQIPHKSPEDTTQDHSQDASASTV
ncbi:hypothetical protein NP233_g4025 [Leucocoprinus birnbaumii]|uniref:Uncharacterized protein n=1 Tax=Leucocoprinus birnbaumii TaxID=56174 RepID=A0AAD5YVX4_9AGAR|nr:hypothetical protein NP233_g4025 [Leucocoprinus birnbaumii]